MNNLICTNCHQPYPPAGTPYRCENCGGIYDFDPFPVFNRSLIDSNLPGIWRYRHAFGLPDQASPVSLGEGITPLIWDRVGDREIAFKLEYLNPTGSFKDRGSPLITSFLKSRGVETAVEDSSGNAGASFAAYAARAGLRATIYVPDSASGPKRIQIRVYGAQEKVIPGPRSNASEAVIQAADSGAPYASHAYLPFNLPGYATLAYELFEQLGQAPGSVIVPIGQGGLLLGMARGFLGLREAGLISRIPSLIGVQARACAPLWAVWSFGSAGLSLVTEETTLAEGIRVRHPVRGDMILALLRKHDGMLIAVDEGEILPGRNALARQGMYVEPTSAVVYPALLHMGAQLSEPIVSILTGSGLKYQD